MDVVSHRAMVFFLTSKTGGLLGMLADRLKTEP
jgi:hypothetical protein